MNNTQLDSTVNDASMSRQEIRASASLASIFALRMLGLFLILPVFAIYAKEVPGGNNALLVGIAMGIYGLTQCFGQIPFGMASDKFGRKRIIVIGLVLFALGSLIAAAAPNLLWVTIGRAVQGLGAISAAVTAMIADSTRDEHRTKAMAMVGASIGLTFALSIVISPVLFRWVGMPGIFALTGVLALVAIYVILRVVPDAPMVKAKRVPFKSVLSHPGLMRLNGGVFILHMTQMAMFVIVPGALIDYAGLPVAEHWRIYLPVVLASFICMLPPVIIGEKLGRMKQVFVGAIALMLLVQIGFWWVLGHPGLHWWSLVLLLFAFFVAFNILEACQPSLVSRIAPVEAKGTALGVYNTLQSLGLFCGGLIGGWVQQLADRQSVFLLCGICVMSWLIMASFMQNIPRRGQS
jgi:MFS family permease